VEAHYIFHPSTIWIRPLFTELGPEKTPKADFAMKQTNICRLSGDIINVGDSRLRRQLIRRNTILGDEDGSISCSVKKTAAAAVASVVLVASLE